MASDSIMDISMNINIEDISCLSENFSMEMSNVTAPPTNLTSVANQKPTDKLSQLNENALKCLSTLKHNMPDINTILDWNKNQIQAVDEKTKITESDLSDLEKKLAIKKRELNDFIEGLEKLKEDNKALESQIALVRKEQKSIIKQMDDMKKHKETSENENTSDQWRVDCYRKLTGVYFGYNPNSPHELNGYAARNGPLKDLKNFKFNTKENSSSFIGDYIWNLLEDLHESNWKDVDKSDS